MICSQHKHKSTWYVENIRNQKEVKNTLWVLYTCRVADTGRVDDEEEDGGPRNTILDVYKQIEEETNTVYKFFFFNFSL